jgi:hypothetical protein
VLVIVGIGIVVGVAGSVVACAWVRPTPPPLPPPLPPVAMVGTGAGVWDINPLTL